MEEIRVNNDNQTLTISLSGRIDSGNADKVEAEAKKFVDENPGMPLVIDMQETEYISSAGLRVLLRLRKNQDDLRLTGVRSEVYEILEMTGFTELMTVEKAYREVSVDGCEVIGEGANGTVYRFDRDTVVKVYKNAEALDEIQHEREVARLALVLGIPTAISYDVVKVGDTYGSVFELLNARSFSKILANQPEQMDWCVREYVQLLKKIHETVVPEGKLPDMRETALMWVDFTKDYLPEDAWKKVKSMVEEIPPDDHMIHGDYHTKNIQLTGDEVLLIDMDTLAAGHPVFELASMYNAFIGFSEYNHDNVDSFLGLKYDLSVDFWRRSLAMYLETDNEQRIREVEDKARIIGYIRLIRRSIRRGGLESEEGKAEIELWKKLLLELLERTDSLLFSRNEICLEAVNENLPDVLRFVESHLEETGCSAKEMMEFQVAVEEIFVNIASYAYAPQIGDAVIRMGISHDKSSAEITFCDRGIPYDPLARQDPDLSLPAQDREIGGLGIFMTRKLMDEIQYEYRDGFNILTLKKYFGIQKGKE